MTPATPTPRCSECGAPLSADLDGLCPACLWGEGDTAATSDDGSGHDFLEEIGRGGMGIIYRARQHQPEREVAAKMLLPHLLDEPGLRERFAAEAHMAASLDHPAILPIYSVGERDGIPFFTMKRARETLAERLEKNGPMPARDAARLIATLADAVDYAHRRGVLHRDLKPGNILFDDAGRAHLADFGLAKAIDGPDARLDLTRSITLLGTPQYLPPEIARGTMKEASTSGDIYALGAILHELLTGKAPHQAPSMPALLRRIADDPVTPPADLPRDLRAILLKCLAKEPAQRYATAAGLAADLNAWLGGKPVSAREPSPSEIAWLWMRRNPLLSGLALVLVVTLATFTLREHQANQRLSRSLADSLIAQAKMTRLDASGSSRHRALDLIGEATTSAGSRPLDELALALRSETIAAEALPVLENVSSWAVLGRGNEETAVFSPDLTHYAAAHSGTGFALFNTATRQPAALPPDGTPHRAPSRLVFSHDGRRLAVVQPPGPTLILGITDATNPQLVEHARLTDGSRLVGFIPDGRFITFHNGQLLAGKAPGEMQPLPFKADPKRLVIDSITPSPDGQQIAAALIDPPELVLWKIEEAAPLWTLPVDAEPQRLAWSSDGAKIAFAEGGVAPVEIGVADATKGRLTSRLPGHGAAVASITFHPDGHTLVSVSYDNRLIWQSAEEGGFSVELPAEAGVPVFSPDGKRLGYSPGRGLLGLAEVGLPWHWRRWAGSTKLGTITCAESTADGKWLVAATLTHLELWSSDGRRIDRQPWPGKRPRWPWFRLHPREPFLICADPGRAFPISRWSFSDAGLSPPAPVPSRHQGIEILHDFTPDGRGWLVSGDTLPRNGQSGSNFYVWPNGDSSNARLLARHAEATGMRFLPATPDRVIGHHSHRSDALLWDTESGDEAPSLGHDEPVFLDVSPDGARVCTLGAREGRLWSAQDLRSIATWPQTGMGRVEPRFSKDGTHLAIASPEGVIHLRSGLDGRMLLVLDPPHPVPDPDGIWLGNNKLLLLSGTTGIWEWDLNSLKKTGALP